MKWHKNFIYTACISFLSIGIYASAWVNPQKIYACYYIAHLIPVVLIYHLIKIVWHLFKQKIEYVSLVLLLSGLPFIFSSISFRLPSNPVISENTIRLINYNVRVFNSYQNFQGENYQHVEEVFSWLKKCDADVVCLQEIYNNDCDPRFHSIQRMAEYGYHYRTVKVSLTEPEAGQYGQATFSKYPIIRQQKIKFQFKSPNMAIVTDILKGGDTIRIYNVHLESFGLPENDYFKERKLDKDKGDLPTTDILRIKIKHRAEQARYVAEHAKNSPYPVLVCGDFNDSPYTYSYRSFNSVLSNTFETKGSGFGLTMNSDFFFFLRLDNQFYGNDFVPTYFSVRYDAPHTDHFPLEGHYILSKHQTK